MGHIYHLLPTEFDYSRLMVSNKLFSIGFVSFITFVLDILGSSDLQIIHEDENYQCNDE